MAGVAWTGRLARAGTWRRSGRVRLPAYPGFVFNVIDRVHFYFSSLKILVIGFVVGAQ